jgi:tetratricopeptide (TPR) repeat protein
MRATIRRLRVLLLALLVLLGLGGLARAFIEGRYAYKKRQPSFGSRNLGYKEKRKKQPGANVAPAIAPPIRVGRPQTAKGVRMAPRPQTARKDLPQNPFVRNRKPIRVGPTALAGGVESSLTGSGTVVRSRPPMGGMPAGSAAEATEVTMRPAGRYSGGSATGRRELPPKEAGTADVAELPLLAVPPEEHSAWLNGYWDWWWQRPAVWPPAGSWRWTSGPWVHEAGLTDYTNPYDTEGKLTAPLFGLRSIPPQAIRQFGDARDAFRSGRYADALAATDRVLKLAPEDPSIHEFRALVLFTLGRYGPAAAELHAVVAATPGFNWPTILGLYSNQAIYTAQLRALEDRVRAHPDDMAARFVLACHYFDAEHLEAAAKTLEPLVAANPGDAVAADLLSLAAPKKAAAAAGALPDSLHAPARWVAERADGGRIELLIGEDGTFDWKFTRDGKTRRFNGRASWSGPVLVLEDQKGGWLLGEIAPHGDDAFALRLYGAPAGDPGLSFRRAGGK